jgi:hypothetical protein
MANVRARRVVDASAASEAPTWTTATPATVAPTISYPDGGSSGQDRNDSTRDGDKLVGTDQVGSAIAVMTLMLARLYVRAVTPLRDLRSIRRCG